MREAPPHLTDEDVLATVNEHWRVGADRIGHLPVGFGAYHWRVSGVDTILFVTFDRLGDRHTAESLEAAYAGAAALSATGLDFVLPPIATDGGRVTVPFEDGALSVTRWRNGKSGDGSMSPARARQTRAMLDRLHATSPPADLPTWRPLVGPDLADELDQRTASGPWESGPFGEDAREAIRERLRDIATWTADYHRLAAATAEDTWVPTHGEPHTRNQLSTPDAVLLIDWESLKLAPRERDLRSLEETGYPQADADNAMLDLFDLEWRLDEIAQYATWFEAWHTGTESDVVAFAGLVGELGREGRHTRN